MIKQPKTQSGIRVIPLLPELQTILEALPKEPEFFILGGAEPYSQTMFNNAWSRIKKAIDIHGATPHIFRHTYLTYLASIGTDGKTLQAISGHSDYSFTMNRYVHPLPEKIVASGSQLHEMFSAK